MLCINDHVAEMSDSQVAALIQLLPAWRRDAALRFRYEQGRRESVVGYVELLRGLRLMFGVNETPDFCYGEHGKPFLADYPDIHFSISHCREAVGCLVSDRPCGLDIERIRSVSDELMHHTMNAEEVRQITSSSFPALTFTHLWTCKEAVLKLRGTGLIDDLHHVLDADRVRDIELRTVENVFRGYVVTTARLLRA